MSAKGEIGTQRPPVLWLNDLHVLFHGKSGSLTDDGNQSMIRSYSIGRPQVGMFP